MKSRKSKRPDDAWINTWAYLLEAESRRPPRPKKKPGPAPSPVKRTKTLTSLTNEELRALDRVTAKIKAAFSSKQGPRAKVSRSQVTGLAALILDRRINSLGDMDEIGDWPSLIARLMELELEKDEVLLST